MLSFFFKWHTRLVPNIFPPFLVMCQSNDNEKVTCVRPSPPPSTQVNVANCMVLLPWSVSLHFGTEGYCCYTIVSQVIKSPTKTCSTRPTYAALLVTLFFSFSPTQRLILLVLLIKLLSLCFVHKSFGFGEDANVWVVCFFFRC